MGSFFLSRWGPENRKEDASFFTNTGRYPKEIMNGTTLQIFAWILFSAIRTDAVFGIGLFFGAGRP
jgi:hypothetical protein